MSFVWKKFIRPVRGIMATWFHNLSVLEPAVFVQPPRHTLVHFCYLLPQEVCITKFSFLMFLVQTWRWLRNNLCMCSCMFMYLQFLITWYTLTCSTGVPCCFWKQGVTDVKKEKIQIIFSSIENFLSTVSYMAFEKNVGLKLTNELRVICFPPYLRKREL